jgi:acyl phosphate:glycerol-3-phosphate acyltransferase
VSAVLLLVVAFFMGSFPSGLLLARLVTGEDVRRLGSGNIGASNVARTAGFKVGAAVAVVDVVKGMLPVIFGLWAAQSHVVLALIALAAVAGHNFSVFLRFRGGKGVATSLGVTLVLAPPAAIFCILTWLVIFLATSVTSLASLAALALLPLYMGVTHQPPAYVVVSCVLFVMAAAKHYQNIIRLAQGTEPSFRKRPARGV